MEDVDDCLCQILSAHQLVGIGQVLKGLLSNFIVGPHKFWRAISTAAVMGPLQHTSLDRMVPHFTTAFSPVYHLLKMAEAMADLTD
jgi:hypothetical protein